MQARSVLLSTALFFCSIAAPVTSGAETRVFDADYTALRDRVRQLEQLVDGLEQRINQLEAASGKQEVIPAASAASVQTRLDTLEQKLQQNTEQLNAQPVLSAGRNTFSISSRDKVFRLRIGGHLQADGKMAYDNKSFYDTSPHQLTDSFILRRARPIFEGSLGQYVDFRFVTDFGSGKALIYDAYADLKLKPYAVIRAGKMKTPLGLEQLQGDADLTFVERSLATDLVPNRDEGFSLYGTINNRINYQVAVLNGAPVGQNYDGDVNNGKDVVGRIFLTPFAPSEPHFLNGLGFGFAASSGRQEGAVLPTFNTTGGQIAFFSYGSGSGANAITPVAAGRRLNYTPQLYYYNGPFGLMAEYVGSIQRISAVVNKAAVAQNIGVVAWQVAGSWVLTGEKKTFKGVVPRKGLEDRTSLGLGAWEIAARYTGLNVDHAAFTSGFADPTKSAQSARTWTVGLHWYLNYFVKLMLDYDQTHFQGGNTGMGGSVGDRPTEKVFSQRLQFAF
jgi:phosphate-selective porin OprO/OprP